MNIVLVNDDGWETPGIQTLKVALRDAGYRVILVGPADPKSGIGALLTFGDGAPVKEGTDEYFLAGSPATCVHAGI